MRPLKVEEHSQVGKCQALTYHSAGGNLALKYLGPIVRIWCEDPGNLTREDFNENVPAALLNQRWFILEREEVPSSGVEFFCFDTSNEALHMFSTAQQASERD